MLKYLVLSIAFQVRLVKNPLRARFWQEKSNKLVLGLVRANNENW